MKRIFLWALSVILLASVSFWAGHTLSSFGQPETEPEEHLGVQVQEQTIGRTLDLNATLERQLAPIATNMREGVVTYVSDAAQFGQGDILYSVAGNPVRVAVGDVPFYRDLKRGDKGPDVHQLIQLLADLGFLRPSDDVFGPVTEKAVMKWQKSEGLEETGVVSLGDLVAIPSQPASVWLDRDKLRTGVMINKGEAVVRATVGSPAMALIVSDSQAQLVPVGAKVTIRSGENEWTALAQAAQKDAETGSYRIPLENPEGGAPCGHQCDVVPGEQKVSLPAKIEIVPSVTGPAVPRAAIRTAPTGAASVFLMDGTEVPVTIEGSADGIAVVDGAEIGTTVRVFGDEQ